MLQAGARVAAVRHHVGHAGQLVGRAAPTQGRVKRARGADALGCADEVRRAGVIPCAGVVRIGRAGEEDEEQHAGWYAQRRRSIRGRP